MHRPSHRSLSTLAALVATLIFVLAAAGCGDDDDSAGGDPPTEAETGDGNGDDGDTDNATSGPRVDDLATLAGMLDGIDDGCTLEYEGLADDQRTVSVCTLGSETAELAVWNDEGALGSLAAGADGSGDPVVVGANWSIDITEPSLAEEIAAATGGSVRS